MAWTTHSTAPIRTGLARGLSGLRVGAAIAFLLSPIFFSAIPASAEGPPRCVDASRADAFVTLAGELTLRSFAGPPNYESVDRGDAEEHALILELPRRICFYDGEFADGSERFDRVHVYATDKRLAETLHAAVGQKVTVAGEAMGAHTAHHRAPMVLLVRSVAVR